MKYIINYSLNLRLQYWNLVFNNRTNVRLFQILANTIWCQNERPAERLF